MQLEQLKELGLSDGQVAVYTAVLELGISSLNRIQEKTGIERRNIYDILNKLIERGLISYTLEKGKKTYQCTHPNKLDEEIRLKQEALAKLQMQIPHITAFFEDVKPDIRAEVYRGTESIKALLNEILRHDKLYVLGGNSFDNYKGAPKNLQVWFGHWMQRRAEKKVMMYDLVSYGMHLPGLLPDDIKTHKAHYYQYCQLPKGMYVPMVVWIFGSKVAQVLWQSQSFAFVLESEKVKDSFMKYFNYFWREPW